MLFMHMLAHVYLLKTAKDAIHSVPSLSLNITKNTDRSHLYEIQEQQNFYYDRNQNSSLEWGEGLSGKGHIGT